MERFTESNKFKQSINNLGPGSYSQTTATTANKKMRNTNYVPFSTSEQRFVEHVSELPGPGQY